MSSDHSPSNPESHRPHASLGASIATAEFASSAASLGAVWAVGRSQWFQSATEWVTKHIVRPLLGANAAQSEEQQMEEARKRTSVILKFMVMLTTGFGIHVPVQVGMEGRLDPSEFKKVIIGKSVGVAAAMGSLALVDYIRPGTIEKVENAVADNILNCDKSKSKEHCQSDREFCKLLPIDVISSVVAGVCNYQVATRFRW